jgi:hypothetical protein
MKLQLHLLIEECTGLNTLPDPVDDPKDRRCLSGYLRIEPLYEQVMSTLVVYFHTRGSPAATFWISL